MVVAVLALLACRPAPAPPPEPPQPPPLTVRNDTELRPRPMTTEPPLPPPRPSSPPRPDIGEALSRYRGDIRACYEASLAANPATSGTVLLRFRLGDGIASEIEVVTDTTGDPTLARCVVERVGSWSFDVSLEGRAQHPFVFDLPSPSAPRAGFGPLRVSIPLDSSFTGIKVQCPRGVERVATFYTRTAEAPDVPIEEACTMYFTGAAPASYTPVHGGESIACDFELSTARCVPPSPGE